LEHSNGARTLSGRIAGRIYRLEELAIGNGYRYHDGIAEVDVSADGSFTANRNAIVQHVSHLLDVGRFHALATLMHGIADQTRIHAVNAPLIKENRLAMS